MYNTDEIELRTRYLDTDNDEYLTIIDKMSTLGAIVQYDDGIVWDHNPALFKGDRFVKMPPKPGEKHPAVSDACDEGAHDFGDILVNDETNDYSPTCNQCGLSLQTLREFGEQDPTDYLPWECENCSRDLPVGSNLREFDEGYFCKVCIAHHTGDYYDLPEDVLRAEFTFQCGSVECEWQTESLHTGTRCPECGSVVTPVHSG